MKQMRRILMVGAALLVVACRGDESTGPSVDSCGSALAVGQVRLISGTDRNEVCVSGGAAGQEYTLIPFYAATSATSNVQLEAEGTGLVAASGPPNPEKVPGETSPLMSVSSSRALVAGVPFEATLRRREIRELAPRMAAARSARSRRFGAQLSRAAATPQVGDLVMINAESNEGCANPSLRTGRVKAITERAIVVADEANPPDGFTDEEYVSIGISFDTLVYPVDVENFGAPSDIDINGRNVIFFTRAVNELTEENSDEFTGGFFFGRDLLPRRAIPEEDYPGCEGSNEAELFYMLVPDPTGIVNNNVRTKEFVRRLTVAVLAHEFQHLINASRRIYVNEALTLEELWLNEGLSHMAEELVFYRAAGLGPGQNIDSLRLRASQRVLDAVNGFQVSNLGRLDIYLEATETNSPYADDDELATRGATWQFLRYAADRKGGDQRATWQALVNSRVAGFANLRAVFGEPLPLIRDWAVAQYTDDAVAGVDASYTHPSWSYRGTVPLLRTPRVFPLKTRMVSDASQTFELAGGGVAYLRFKVAAAGTGSVRVTSQGTTPTADVQLVLVRTK
jgi:hypothetical protein